MHVPKFSKTAIVDFGLGNLYSVKHACAYVGLPAIITSSKQDILSADAVILPGVGAYGDAMSTLRKLDLVSVLRDIAASSTPFVGICLGVQLLMTESYEFGRHRGLDIIEGPVVRFSDPMNDNRRLKVPQIGWNHIYSPKQKNTSKRTCWNNTLLEGVANGEHMYFVHSYIVQPKDSSVVLSTSRYGNVEFCSSLQHQNVFACQFHPERSGVEGLKIYHNLARYLRSTSGE
jgi:glutamine amidotransferase